MPNLVPSDRISEPMQCWPKRNFICKVCKLPGIGPLTVKVHPGKCRKIWQAKINRDLRQRREKAAAA